MLMIVTGDCRCPSYLLVLLLLVGQHRQPHRGAALVVVDVFVSMGHGGSRPFSSVVSLWLQKFANT